MSLPNFHHGESAKPTAEDWQRNLDESTGNQGVLAQSQPNGKLSLLLLKLYAHPVETFLTLVETFLTLVPTRCASRGNISWLSGNGSARSTENCHDWLKKGFVFRPSERKERSKFPFWEDFRAWCVWCSTAFRLRGGVWGE